jgi:hypothetical protein
MTVKIPAATARSAAVRSITPSCSHSAGSLRRMQSAAVAEALQSARHAVARTGGIGGQADDGDGVRGAQEARDLLSPRVDEHDGSMAFGSSGV